MTWAENPVAMNDVGQAWYGPHDYRRRWEAFSKRGTACPLRKCFRTLLACFGMLPGVAGFAWDPVWLWLACHSPKRETTVHMNHLAGDMTRFVGE